jgi:16S rRNA G966 N2-methylase RsmD
MEKRNQMIADAKKPSNVSNVLDGIFNKDNDRINLILADMVEREGEQTKQKKEIPDNSIALIFTDPPYSTKDGAQPLFLPQLFFCLGSILPCLVIIYAVIPIYMN